MYTMVLRAAGCLNQRVSIIMIAPRGGGGYAKEWAEDVAGEMRRLLNDQRETLRPGPIVLLAFYRFSCSCDHAAR